MALYPALAASLASSSTGTFCPRMVLVLNEYPNGSAGSVASVLDGMSDVAMAAVDMASTSRRERDMADSQMYHESHESHEYKDPEAGVGPPLVFFLCVGFVGFVVSKWP